MTSSENKLKYRFNSGYVRVDKEISYDYLVIATGATSFIPSIEGINLKGVFKIRTIEDGLKIKNWAEKSQNAVVVGAGLIGLETAYALKKMGLEVVVTEMLPQIVPRSLDPDMAKIVQEYLESEGVKLILSNPIDKIKGEKRVEKTVFAEDVVDTDMVIMATGIRPHNKACENGGV